MIAGKKKLVGKLATHIKNLIAASHCGYPWAAHCLVLHSLTVSRLSEICPSFLPFSIVSFHALEVQTGCHAGLNLRPSLRVAMICLKAGDPAHTESEK